MINTIQLIEEESHNEIELSLKEMITEDLKNLWNILAIREEE